MQGGISEIESADGNLAAEAGRYWRQSDSRPWVQDMSHWRGRGRWADDDAWSAPGRRHLQLFDQLCTLTGRTGKVRSMLEWGPGGGVNAVIFSGHVERFHGVDISPANLAECGRQLQAIGFAGWHPLEIDPLRPEGVIADVTEPVDFVLCTAVFQHFPSQDYGVRVLRVMHEILAADGIALIQTRYDDGSETLRCKTSDYAKNVVTFTSYRIEQFWEIGAANGFEPVSIVLQPEPCYAFYMLRKGAGRE
jgi:SAM-dependent methyltransferase